MSNGNKRVIQTSQYDKLVKENLELTLPSIIKALLHLDIVHTEEIPDDLQHTKERKSDALKKVRDAQGKEYVLHVEFQLGDDRDMVYRMAEYSIMLMRRYRLPVKQFVLFLKESIPKMAVSINQERLKYSYELIRIADVSYTLFLKEEKPEVRMLGILSNLGDGDKYHAVEAIVKGIDETVEEGLKKQKYFEQLRIFVQLRNHIKDQLDKAMESVSTFFKEENDSLFCKGLRLGEEKGIEKGIEKTQELIVRNLLKQTTLQIDKIAKIAGVDTACVVEIRAKLS